MRGRSPHRPSSERYPHAMIVVDPLNRRERKNPVRRHGCSPCPPRPLCSLPLRPAAARPPNGSPALVASCCGESGSVPDLPNYPFGPAKRPTDRSRAMSTILEAYWSDSNVGGTFLSIYGNVIYTHGGSPVDCEPMPYSCRFRDGWGMTAPMYHGRAACCPPLATPPELPTLGI